jgi:uncharacterized protein YutE (UPF0331/DUF86 family)
MTPKLPNTSVVERRLAHQRDLLAAMRTLQPVTAARLADEPILKAALERMIQAVVDLALDINGHVVTSLLSKSPATGRDSFDLMVEAGVLEGSQADVLKPAVGLRNILVHMYADIDLGVLADSTVTFEVGFSGYVRSVARWLLDNTPDL